MSSLFVLIPLGALFAGVAALFFAWAVQGRQFEGLDDLAQRLPDEEP